MVKRHFMFNTTSTRLNKYISASGICSRRDADRFIEQGNVFINGKRASIGDQVAPGDTVRVNGQIIEPKEADAFITSLPIERFHGIGKATAAKLHDMGIHTGAELKATSVDTLVNAFGKRGRFYSEIAHGRDMRPVKSKRQYKSVGSETTFRDNISDTATLLEHIFEQNADAFRQMGKKGQQGQTITLKIKYADFSQITRSHTLHTPFPDAESAHYWLGKLLADAPRHLPIRLVGVTYSTLSNADEPAPQPDLFDLFDD